MSVIHYGPTLTYTDTRMKVQAVVLEAYSFLANLETFKTIKNPMKILF